MMEAEVEGRPLESATDKTLRQFAGLWLTIFGALAWWQGLHHHRAVVGVLLAVASVLVGIPGLLVPRTARPVFATMTALSSPIRLAVSYVVLAAVFLLVVTPLGVLFRLIGRDPLRLRPRRGSKTYLEPKPAASNAAGYLRQS